MLVTHLSEVFRRNAAELLSRQDVQQLLNNLKVAYPAVVEDLLGGLMTLGEIQRILQNLLNERVSIRDLLTITETLATAARMTKDPELLTEQVRQALGRGICAQYAGEDRVLHVVTLSPRLEQKLLTSLQPSDQGPVVLVEPARANRIVAELSARLDAAGAAGSTPVALCSGRLRRPLRRLTEHALPNSAVLAFGEVAGDVEVRSEGVVDVGEV